MIRRRGGRYTIPRRVAEGFAEMSATARGCDCQPELTIRHEHGVTHAVVAHDAWCAALAGDEG